MEAGALQAKWTDRTNPLDKFVNVMNEEQGFNQAPPAAQMFGGAGREDRWKYGTKKATVAKKVYEQSGLGPEDVDVIELHDCFTANELLTYEALGLCKEGEAEKFIWDGDNTYGGKFVTNPSGGLLSKGHPLGATGLAQCTELVWQLRGQAEARQVDGAKIALQHALGLGGACVVTMYRRD